MLNETQLHEITIAEEDARELDEVIQTQSDYGKGMQWKGLEAMTEGAGWRRKRRYTEDYDTDF